MSRAASSRVAFAASWNLLFRATAGEHVLALRRRLREEERHLDVEAARSLEVRVELVRAVGHHQDDDATAVRRVADMNSLSRAMTRAVRSAVARRRTTRAAIGLVDDQQHVAERRRRPGGSSRGCPRCCPTHFSRKFLNLMQVSPLSAAKASATKVFPVPIGPTKMMPIGTRLRLPFFTASRRAEILLEPVDARRRGRSRARGPRTRRGRGTPAR